MMVPLRFALVLACLAGCAACKSDSKPTSMTTGGGTGSAATPTAPARPGKPVDQATFDEISKLDFEAPGTVMEISDSGLVMRVAPAGEPATMGTIRLSRCLNCVAMDRALWEPRLQELRQLLPKEVRDKPDTVFELGDVTVHGTKVMYVYQLAVDAVGGVDGKPLERAMNTHAYTIYWNDGVNQVQIAVKDDTAGLADDEQLRRRYRATISRGWRKLFATRAVRARDASARRWSKRRSPRLAEQRRHVGRAG
jgi:hypothetical protein